MAVTLVHNYLSSLESDLEGQAYGTSGYCSDPTGWTSDVTCLILRLTPATVEEAK